MSQVSFQGLSRLSLLAIGAAPLPLLAGWAVYARTAGLGADATRVPLILAIGWAIAFGLLSWRRLDEGGREAIKFSWCWGAGPGMMLAATALLMLALFPEPASNLVEQMVERYGAMREGSFASSPDAVAFFLGGVFVIVVQQMLFGAVWLGWWARRRAGV